MIDIVVSINVDGGAGQTATVDQAGVIERIAEDGVRAAGQRADDGEIGGVTAAENEGRLRALPFGQRAFERTQRRRVSRTPTATRPPRMP